MEVEEKIEGMQKYIPCLKLLIGNLEKNPTKETQLKKMQYLLDMLTKKDTSIKLETLNRCEGVLMKMYDAIEDSQTSFGEDASSNGENDSNGQAQADINGCNAEEVTEKNDGKDTANSVEKMDDVKEAEEPEEEDCHGKMDDVKEAEESEEEDCHGKVNDAKEAEEPEEEDCHEKNLIEEAKNEEKDENTENDKSHVVKPSKQAVETLESEPNDLDKTHEEVVNENEENTDKADESAEAAATTNNESENFEETEFLETSCELDKSTIESQPSQNKENADKEDKSTEATVTAKNESKNIEETELLETSCELDKSTTESQPPESKEEKTAKESHEETETITDKQTETKRSENKDTTPELSATEGQFGKLTAKVESESTEKENEPTATADCNNDDCDMDIDEELTNSTVTTSVDPPPLPFPALSKEVQTTAQKSTGENSEQPKKSQKAGVVDLTSDDSDTETANTKRPAKKSQVKEKVVIKPTKPVERPAAVYLLNNDKTTTPAKSAPTKKTPAKDPPKDPLQCDNVPANEKNSKITTIDLLDSDSDDESAKKAKTSPTVKNNCKMPTPKLSAEKPMFTIASVQSINSVQTQTEKRREVEKTLLEVVKTAQSTMHHTVPQKHNAAVRVYLDKFVADLMYEKNRVNLCLQKLQALLPLDMYRQVKRVIQTFCSEPVHDPTLPAPSPFCHRIKVYPEKLQFVMRSLFYSSVSISVIGYKLYSLDKKNTGLPKTMTPSPVRPIISSSPSTPRPGQSPTTPRPGQSPTTPRPGQSPTTPRPGQSPTTPRPGQSPMTPRPGQSPTTPRPGQSPATPRPVQNLSTPRTLQNSSTPKPGQTPSNSRSLLMQPNRTTPHKLSPQKQPVIRPVQPKATYAPAHRLPQAINRISSSPSVPALSAIQAVSLPTTTLPNDDLLAPMKSQSVSPESLEHSAQSKQRRRKRRNDEDDDDDDDDENYVPQGYFSASDDPSEEQSENSSRRTSLQRASKVRCQKYLELERSIDDETYIRAAEATFAKVKPQKPPGTPKTGQPTNKRIRAPRPKKKPEPEPEPEPEPPSEEDNPDDENDVDYKESGAESESEPPEKRQRSDAKKCFDLDEEDDDCEPPPKLDTKSINYAKNITKAYHCRSQYINRCVICHEKLHIRRIVSHYIKNHRDREVYISRITKSDLMKLQSETMSFGFLSGSKTAGSQYVAYCIFCQQEHTLTVEKWWEHYTRHTGEYQYECSACGAKRSARQQLNRHVNIECTLKDKNPTVIAPDEFDPEITRIDAYVCLLCRYIQLRIEPILKHLHTEHGLSIVADEIPEGTFQMINLFRIEHNYYESNDYESGPAPPVPFQADHDDMSFMICNMLATTHNTSGEQTPAIGSGAEKAPIEVTSESLMNDDRSQSPEMIIPEVFPPMDLINNMKGADVMESMEQDSGELQSDVADKEPLKTQVNKNCSENDSSKTKSQNSAEADIVECEKTDAREDNSADAEMADSSTGGRQKTGDGSGFGKTDGTRDAEMAAQKNDDSSTGDQQDPEPESEPNEGSVTENKPHEPAEDVSKTNIAAIDSESQEAAIPTPVDDEVSTTSDDATAEESINHKTTTPAKESIAVADSDGQVVSTDPTSRDETNSLPSKSPQTEISLLSELKSIEELAETATQRIFLRVTNSLVDSMLDSTDITTFTSESTSDLPETASESSDSIENGSTFLKSNDAPIDSVPISIVEPMELIETQPTESLSQIEKFIVNTSVAETESETGDGDVPLEMGKLVDPLEATLSADGDNAVDGMTGQTADMDHVMESSAEVLSNDADVEMADGEKESC